MVHYSVQLKDQKFVKRYGCFPFAKNMSKNIGKNISINLCGKYNQKLLYNAKQSATDVFKTTSKRTFKTAIQRTAETAGESQLFQEVHRRIFQKHVEEIPIERFTSPEERQKIIGVLKINIIV